MVYNRHRNGHRCGSTRLLIIFVVIGMLWIFIHVWQYKMNITNIWNIILLQHIHNKDKMHATCANVFCTDKEPRWRLKRFFFFCGGKISYRNEEYPESWATEDEPGQYACSRPYGRSLKGLRVHAVFQEEQHDGRGPELRKYTSTKQK